MRLNIGAKFVAAKKRIAAKERVAFALEVKIVRQPMHLVATFFHPVGKERLFTGAFFVAEITGDEFATHGQPGVRSKNNIGRLGRGRNRLNLERNSERV